MIRGLAVVVPAHQEELLLGDCLRSVGAALDASDVPLRERHVVVVADACTDRTASVARAAGAHVVAADHRNVGAARRTGAGHALRLVGRTDLDAVWLAVTDADTLVPRHWIAEQLRHARDCDAVVGTVAVRDWSSREPGFGQRFERVYPRDTGGTHPHVHGANLGVRASAYSDVGGFPPLPCSEDLALVTALEAAGYRVRRPLDLAVTTSARPDPRARGGFGDHLTRTLGADGRPRPTLPRA
ncbi:glycosyltransferase [Nocardiopsis sp. NPDC006198]|uniref:glycosyltransferase n=1 Tax=Nocardiopsis sp. NPDC006198 TaxID=3154472 RepID=UPI0033A5F236